MQGAVILTTGRLRATTSDRSATTGRSIWTGAAGVPDLGGDGADSWQSLAATERRVAALVAGGMTNRGIAECMDANLKHIHVKVNIH